MQRELLESIKNDIAHRREQVRIRGHLRLTKTERAFCDAVLLRDLELEHGVRGWIEDRTSAARIMERYRAFADTEIAATLPEHFAMRVLSGHGSICSGRNIFLFFPQCLGLEGGSEADVFGLELIDVWRNVFEKVVFPCARLVFDEASLMATVPALFRSIEKTTYLAAVFHEVGHRVGPWRVSPAADPALKVSTFHLDVMGELATDCLLVQNLPEFDEITMFVTLQRLFWFGRRGYLDNPRSAWFNVDNDSWITGCLWNELRRADILRSGAGGRWELRTEKLRDFYRDLYAEIEELGRRVLATPTAEGQDELVAAWMRSKVECDAHEGFLLPDGLRRAFATCARVPEIPQFNPILDLNLEELA